MPKKHPLSAWQRAENGIFLMLCACTILAVKKITNFAVDIYAVSKRTSNFFNQRTLMHTRKNTKL